MSKLKQKNLYKFLTLIIFNSWLTGYSIPNKKSTEQI